MTSSSDFSSGFGKPPDTPHAAGGPGGTPGRAPIGGIIIFHRDLKPFLSSYRYDSRFKYLLWVWVYGLKIRNGGIPGGRAPTGGKPGGGTPGGKDDGNPGGGIPGIETGGIPGGVIGGIPGGGIGGITKEKMLKSRKTTTRGGYDRKKITTFTFTVCHWEWHWRGYNSVGRFLSVFFDLFLISIAEFVIESFVEFF